MITVSRNSTLNRQPFINGAEFKSLSISHQSKPIAISLRKAKSIQKQQTLPHCEIEFLDFDSKFIFEIIEIEGELPSNELALYLKYDDNVLKITLLGEWNDNEGLYVNNFGFDVQQQGETSYSAFLLKTFWAMLGLSAKLKIKIPVLNQEAIMSFDTSLNAISELLETRQIAYKLMVIERTYGISLNVPDFIEGEDIGNIIYCYHSIIDRKFEWFCNPNRKVGEVETENFSPSIFGYQINLGTQRASVIKIGKVQIESMTTPTLPKNAFSRELQKLIDLDSKFDSMFFDKYLNSFSNAFEGLTDEQVQAITERPTLEEEAFNF